MTFVKITEWSTHASPNTHYVEFKWRWQARLKAWLVNTFATTNPFLRYEAEVI